MKTIKSIITAIIIIVTTSSSFAQNTKPTFEIKTAPYTFLFSGVGFAAEVDTKAIGVEVDYTSFKFKLIEHATKNAGVNFKYFTSKDAEGFYALATYKYSQTVNPSFTHIIDENNYEFRKSEVTSNFSSVGFGAGYKIVSRQHIVFDGGASFGRIIAGKSSSEVPFDAKAYIRVGYRF
jgi:hypothetical protein